MLCMSQNNKATGTNLLWSFGFDGGTYTTRKICKMNNYLTPSYRGTLTEGSFPLCNACVWQCLCVAMIAQKAVSSHAARVACLKKTVSGDTAVSLHTSVPTMLGGGTEVIFLASQNSKVPSPDQIFSSRDGVVWTKSNPKSKVLTKFSFREGGGESGHHIPQIFQWGHSGIFEHKILRAGICSCTIIIMEFITCIVVITVPCEQLYIDIPKNPFVAIKKLQ